MQRIAAALTEDCWGFGACLKVGEKESYPLVRDEERLARETPNFRAAQNVRSLQLPQSLKNLSHIFGTSTVFQINLMNLCYENNGNI